MSQRRLDAFFLALTPWLLLILLPGCNTRKYPDVLLVTIETLRADRLGVYGSRLGLSPNLDRFAGDSLLFKRAYAVTPITGPSLSSAFTSHYPHETKITDNGLTIPPGILTLTEFLRQQGYETAAVVSNPVLAAPKRLDRGFDSYDDDLPEQERYREEPTRRAGRTTDAALKRWRSRGMRPLFLWVHYMDPHGPYEAPDEFVEKAARVTGPENQVLSASPTNRGWGGIPKYQYLSGRTSSRDYLIRHHAAVAYLDRELGRLLDAPEISRLRTSGLICITADHGEALGEHNTWFAHGENIYEEMLHVPWFVRGRGIQAGRRSDLVSLIDLLPSLQEYLKKKPGSSLRGVPVFLRPAPPNRILLAETFPATSVAERYAAIASEETLIFSEPGHWEYYVTRNQHRSLARERPEAVRSLGRRLRHQVFQNDLQERIPASPDRVLSPETVRRLRSLGYLN